MMAKNRKHIWLCPCCMEAIRSRGEKITEYDTIYQTEGEEGEDQVCEWCEEWSDEMTECEFR